MQIVIPMSGRGERFRRAGHAAIKPLVEIDGRPMIEHVVAMFPGARDLVFVCAEDHLATTTLGAVLERVAPSATIVPIAPHKRGPVHAVLAARAHVRRDVPIVVNYCDFAQDWDFAEFQRTVREHGCAGAITAYRGFHPHHLGPTMYGYMRTEGRRVLEIREKQPFTDARMDEWASAGTYYFDSGARMLAAFDRAVADELSTGGEFYASTPFNPMIADGLTVEVYPVEHFLQWGTPEDLAEYQGWSDLFARPPRTTRAVRHPGTTLVTMAGRGARFAEAGWREPKPLVPVAGLPMVERALATLPPPARGWLALCRAEDAADPAIRGALERVAPGIEIAAIGATEGQAATCLAAADRVAKDAPLLIAPCDTALVYDEAGFAALIADPAVEAIVFAFRDHPPANRRPSAYGWIAADGGRVTRISCKVPLHDDVRGDLGVTGIFWARRADWFFDAARALIVANRRTNGELYLDDAVGLMAERGHDVRAFEVERYVSLGTPDEVRTFEYWQRWFARHPRSRG